MAFRPKMANKMTSGETQKENRNNFGKLNGKTMQIGIEGRGEREKRLTEQIITE